MPSLLTEIQIKERVKHPQKAQAIQRAIKHEDRLRLHTEIALTKDRASSAVHDFLKYAESLLVGSPDKFRLWLSLYRYPVKTVQITDKIYDALRKIHDGQNPVYRVDFISQEYGDDFADFDAKSQETWDERVFEQAKLFPNTIVIEDTPAEQVSTLPEPYSYFLNIRNAIDFDTVDNTFQWIIFRTDETHFTYFDNVSRISFSHEKGKIDQAIVISNVTHDLNRCPAAWLIDTPISQNDPDVKLSPLSTHLEELDFLLFLLIAKNQTDLSASYPVSWSYEEDCNYSREDTDKGIYVKCDHGHLRDKNAQWIQDQNGSILRCPVCSGSRMTGPGTHIGVPVPSKNDGDIALGDPAGFIGVDVETLKHLVAEIQRRTLNLYQDITGYGAEPSKEAINEKQVIAGTEERTAILRQFKRPFERIKKWDAETKCLDRYGSKFISCTYDMGTEFYLWDAGMILSMYKDAQTADLDTIILDRLLDQYHAAIYRNNKDELLKYEIKKNLQPYRHLTRSKAISLGMGSTDINGIHTDGVISKKDLQIILNFSTFVLRFEREQAPLLEFGKNLTFDKRIEAIQQILYSYA